MWGPMSCSGVISDFDVHFDGVISDFDVHFDGVIRDVDVHFDVQNTSKCKS